MGVLSGVGVGAMKEIRNPVKPSREPDFTIKNDITIMNDICFWWEERVQSNGRDLYYMDPDDWTFMVEGGDWLLYTGWCLWREISSKVKGSYATWLLEKELSRE